MITQLQRGGLLQRTQGQIVALIDRRSARMERNMIRDDAASEELRILKEIRAYMQSHTMDMSEKLQVMDERLTQTELLIHGDPAILNSHGIAAELREVLRLVKEHQLQLVEHVVLEGNKYVKLEQLLIDRQIEQAYLSKRAVDRELMIKYTTWLVGLASFALALFALLLLYWPKVTAAIAFWFVP